MEKFNEIKNNLKNYIKSFSTFNSYNFEASNLSFILDILSFFGYNQELSKEELIRQSFLNSSDDINFIFAHAHNMNKSVFSSPEKFVFEFSPIGFNNVDYFEISSGPIFSLNIDGIVKILSSESKIILKNEVSYLYLTGGLYLNKTVYIEKKFPYYVEDNIYENYVIFPSETKIYYYDEDKQVDSSLYKVYEYGDFFVIFFDETFFRFPQEKLKIKILVDDNNIDVSSSKLLSFVGEIFKISGGIKNRLNEVEKNNIVFKIVNKINKKLYNDLFKLKNSIIFSKKGEIDYSNLFIYEFCDYFNLNLNYIRYKDEKRELKIYPPVKIDKSLFKSFIEAFDKKTNFRFYKKINIYNPIISSLFYITKGVSKKISIKINDNENIIDIKKFLAQNYVLDNNGEIFLEILESFNDFTFLNNIIIDLSKSLDIYKLIVLSDRGKILESESLNVKNINYFVPPGNYRIRLYTKDFVVKNINNLFIKELIISNEYK